MKRKRNGALFAILAATTITCVLAITISVPDADSAASDSDLALGSCTMFMASFGDTVLYGNNEDYMRTLTYYWVRLPGKDTYGGVYQGTTPKRRSGHAARSASIVVAEEIARQAAAARRAGEGATQPMPLRIKDLFSAETVRKAEQEHQKYKNKKFS